MKIKAAAGRLLTSRHFYTITLLYLAVGCGLVSAFVSYFGSAGRATGVLRGDLVYCSEKVIDLGDCKHLDGVRSVVRLENLTDEPLRIEGMNSFGQSMLSSGSLPIEIKPRGAVEIPFYIIVRSTNKNPRFEQQIAIYIGSKQYGRQEVGLVVKGNVVDAHLIEPTGCCGG